MKVLKYTRRMCLCLAMALAIPHARIAAQSARPIRIQSFAFDEGGKHAVVGVGLSCAYSFTDADTVFVYCCSHSSRQGVIKLNGRFEVLRQIGGRSSSIFGNARYRVTIDTKGEEESDTERGTMTVKDLHTGRRQTVLIVGGCSI